MAAQQWIVERERLDIEDVGSKAQLIGQDSAAELDELARAAGARDFAAWVGTENYEMRVAADGSWIDVRILEVIRATRGDSA